MSHFCEYNITDLPNGKVLLECKNCTFKKVWSHPKLVRPCGARPAPQPVRAVCAHRGEDFRLEECPTCGGKGKVRVKVFPCPIHGECTRTKKLPETSVKCCQSCGDWVALPTLPSQ